MSENAVVTEAELASEDRTSVGDTVTVTLEELMKKDWLSLGVDEDTEFTVMEVIPEAEDMPDSWMNPATVVLHDADGEEYVTKSTEIIFA